VYTGKAVLGMLGDIADEGEEQEECNICYIHTGGMFGLFDKSVEVRAALAELDRDERRWKAY
jgi:1-aminocyclopropane-1-carboxylate deaminase/D-cysteine desulfhydrase-like pyridoxal-dependent ACC family enzyme